jgi:hypothetical protein
MQEEARTKYGLTAEQIKDASDQVDELIAEAQATAAANQEDAGLLSKFNLLIFSLSLFTIHQFQLVESVSIHTLNAKYLLTHSSMYLLYYRC